MISDSDPLGRGESDSLERFSSAGIALRSSCRSYNARNEAAEQMSN